MKKVNIVSVLRISEDLFESIKDAKQGIVLCHVANGNENSLNEKVVIATKIISSDKNEEGLLLYFHEENLQIGSIKLNNYIDFSFIENQCTAFYYADGIRTEISKIGIIGSDIRFFFNDECSQPSVELNKRFLQTFGKRTTNLLSKLKIGVVGVSGTGSPTAEMLYRLNIGTLVLVDSDKVEEKNLGRIYNTSKKDVGRFKVDVIANAYKDYALGTKVIPLPTTTMDPNTIRELSQCDVIFGCVDTHSGRAFLDSICNYYLIPVFDIGVKLTADGLGSISDCCYSINYIKPGYSTLLSRNVINQATIESEDLKYSNPEEYNNRLSEKYIKGVNEDSPAVISINTMAASTAVNDFLARIHCFRNVENNKIAKISFNLMDPAFCAYDSEEIFDVDTYLSKKVGLGDRRPLLDMPVLSEE